MKIQIWSDIMCPFCYIAKKNFEKALENFSPANEVKVEWKTYQLDPVLDEYSGNMSIKEYFTKNRGMSEVQLQKFLQQLTQMGKTAGIEFNHEITLAANTHSAHKLLHYAKDSKKADIIKEALFAAYFVQGENVANTDFLISLAEQFGLDQENTKKALRSDQYDYDISMDLMEARNLGISGVPYFIFDEKYIVSGAQPVEVFTETLHQAYQQSTSQSSMNSGNNTCDDVACNT